MNFLRSRIALSRFILIHAFTSLFISSEDINTSSLPKGLSFYQYTSIFSSETSADFDGNEMLFKTSMEFEWNRFYQNNDTEYPFLICDWSPNKEVLMEKQQRITTKSLISNKKNNWDDITLIVDDKTCMLAQVGGWDITHACLELGEEGRQFLTIQPLTQSMKMGYNLVTNVKRQLSGNFNSNISDTKNRSVFFVVTFCPDVVTGRDKMLGITKAARLVVKSLVEDPKYILSSSYYYHIKYGDDQMKEKYLNMTDRIKFWADALDNGLNNDTCRKMLKDDIITEKWRDRNSVKFIVNLSGAKSTVTEEACVWSLIQGISLHHATCQINMDFHDDTMEREK